ncbi:MAG TPA: MoaD/ThiS family protein [Syntrophorhabdus sp.]|nr:MoaD/ThiS family protein [Syntrophorhabdus sp.]MDI9559034.1 MoaD/ThiS family protein [Pseudomonadota bacterium]OPX93386.1 MAG: ThiS family protein [Syntrophorhabdus sp. PtaB.Bin027]OQB77069.1 MAG: ThiS family protein [Deltaproteobacteria bacterium ADurb.Bin135]NMC94102.1 MoaD/ThiS family protein [Syntrophorhabdus sp.]
MKVKVHSILQLKEILGGKDVEIIVPDGTNVSGLLAGMVEIWGDSLSPHIFKPQSDEVLPYIRLMINGTAIQSLDGMETILNDGDEVLLIPLAAGG